MSNAQLSSKDFITELASESPVPGGGGAAALTAAIGTALCNMVGSLTVGKAKYASAQDEIQELKAKASALQDTLLVLIDKDAEVFLPLSQAYSLPKGTEEELARKTQVMEICLVECAEVPLAIMRACGEALVIAEDMEKVGTEIAMSDVGCGALTLKAALLSADLNVRINTNLMKDREKALSINKEADELIALYENKANKTYQKVLARFS